MAEKNGALVETPLVYSFKFAGDCGIVGIVQRKSGIFNGSTVSQQGRL